MDPESSIQRMTLTVWGVAVAVWPTTPAAMSVLGLNYFKGNACNDTLYKSLVLQCGVSISAFLPIGLHRQLCIDETSHSHLHAYMLRLQTLGVWRVLSVSSLRGQTQHVSRLSVLHTS